MNDHQKRILYILMYKKESHFSELNAENLSSDLFNYHIKVLVKQKYLYKQENSLYTLTEQGKEFISKFDSHSKVEEKQSVIVATAVCYRKINSQEEYLIHQRKREPSHGFFSFPQGKVKFGETYEEAVIRELREETGLTGTPFLTQVVHKRIFDNKKIYRDMLFFIYRIEDLKGKLINTEEGENYWLSYEEFSQKEKIFHDDLESIKVLHNDFVTYQNISVNSDSI